jgi:predicted HicB family RNase H-like nuclease
MSNRFNDVVEDTEETGAEGTEEAVNAALGANEGETKRLNVRVPAPLYKQFKEKAESEGRTMTWLVLQWIRDYVAE